MAVWHNSQGRPRESAKNHGQKDPSAVRGPGRDHKGDGAPPTRLFLVDVLSRGERCVCELTEMVGADVSTVSKHLSILKGAGVVEDDRRGSKVFYTLKVPCVMSFFSCVETVLSSAAGEMSRRAR